jgi:hypothetical protein
MFHETYAQRDGYIIKSDSATTIGDLVISGPNYYVATPYAKEPRENNKSKGDYDEVELTQIADNYFPKTVYKITALGLKNIPEFKDSPITANYRHVNRVMAQPSNERTLICAIIPPQISHIHSSLSLTFTTDDRLCQFSGFASTIVYDFLVRLTGKQNITEDVLKLLPIANNSLQMLGRVLRLNCVTIDFAPLWEKLYAPNFNQDNWSLEDQRLGAWKNLTSHWHRNTPLRTQFERRQAMVELDVLAAISVGLDFDELITIYRVQFPVLHNNERRLRFDQRGREVPMKTIGGELGVDESHPKFPEMVPPFTPVDREEDYRVAWEFFEEKLKKDKNEPGSRPGTEKV